MPPRTYMIEYREKNGLDLLAMARRCKISRNLLEILESSEQEVTHYKIAERIGRAYHLTVKQTESLMPEHYRKSSPKYDPDKYRRIYQPERCGDKYGYLDNRKNS